MKRYIALMIAALLCVQTLLVCNVAYAAVEPLNNLIANGDMEGDTVPTGWAVSSSASGSTLSIVADSENPDNKVLRFDGSANTGSISYCSNAVTLRTGYYYSFKIRLAAEDTHQNVYLYTQVNAQRQNNNTDRPKLNIGEWITVSGYVSSNDRKLSFKIVNNQSTSSGSANVTNVIYEIDDVVVCDPTDAVEFTPVIIYDGATLHWESGVVEMAGTQYVKAGSEASFTLTAPLGYEIGSVMVNDDVLEAVDEVYTFTIPDDLSCVINITTVADMGIPHILSVDPQNCNNMDPCDAVVTVGFDREMDITSMTEDNILVEPAATFSVEEAAEDYTYHLIFDELSEGTEYSITFTSGVQTDVPMGLEEEVTYTFTTAQAVTNILENGDMSADTDLYYINSDNSPSYKTIGDERVLYWKVGWENAPISQYVNGEKRAEKYQLLPGHKYYSEAKIMATKDIKIGWRLMYTTETDSSTAHPTSITWVTVRAGEWTDISYLFDQIPANVLPTSLGYAVRLVAKTDSYPVEAYIDDWGLYDCTVAPAGMPELVSSSPANGTTDIAPGTLDVTLNFDKPMLPKTAKNIEVTNADVKGIEFSADKKSCVVSLDGIRVNRNINMTLKNLSSMAGEEMEEQVLSFATREISTATPVLTITPNGVGKTHSKGLKMVVTSDLPLDGPIDRASVTSVPANLLEKVEWSDSNAEVMNIVFNQDVLTPGGSYSVTLLPTIKSQAGTSINETTVSFETYTIDETVALYQTLISGGSESALATFLNTNYGDLNDADSLFSEVIYTDGELLSQFITNLLSTGASATTAEEIATNVWKTSLLTIANESNDASVVNKSVDSILSQADKTGLADTYSDVLTQATKDELVQNILQKPDDFEDVEEYIHFVEEEIILNAFRNSNGWETVKKIFNDNKDFFAPATKTLIDKVNHSAYATKIYNRLQGMNAADESQVYALLKAAYEKDYAGGTTGGTTGSGSSGGSGAVVAVPIGGSEKDSISEKKASFQDVSSVPWAVDAIEYLYDLKVINGKAQDMFYPQDFVKREEFVKMIAIAANIPLTEQPVKYTDVSESDWFYPYVAAASGYGLVNGIGNNVYGVGQNITRQDIAVLCSRLLVNAEEPLKDEIVNFADNDKISDYAAKAVEKVAYLGLMIGNENLEFSPQEYATRAETAVILQRLVALLNQYGTN
ncbi:MAG: S-layer homology domain-containing protein [Clostridia bacterium]|nr:S-layer homology domain-containing protein [Clostridia bacterium]